jgi:hypothetical protein
MATSGEFAVFVVIFFTRTLTFDFEPPPPPPAMLTLGVAINPKNARSDIMNREVFLIGYSESNYFR